MFYYTQEIIANEIILLKHVIRNYETVGVNQ